MASSTNNTLWIDPKSQFALNGWVAVPPGAETSTQFVVNIDDLQPLSLRTRLFQKNVMIDGERASRLKFTAIYPAELYDGRQHAVDVVNLSDGTRLYSATAQFEDLRLYGRSGRRFIGGVHFIAKAGHIEGWIFDRDAPGQQIAVDLFIDGRRIGREFASITTPNMLVGGDERHGFRLQIPAAFVDGAEHRFEVQVDGVPLPAVENTFLVKAPDQSHSIDGLTSFYARFETIGFEHLRGFVKTEARGNASLAFYVDETLISKRRLEQTLQHGLVEFKLRIPDELYDGTRKSFSVRVAANGPETIVYSASRIMSPKLVEQARIFGLAVVGGRLTGKVAIQNDWTLDGTMGLFAGEIRAGSSELAAQPGGWGEPAEFSFDLAPLSAVPWLKTGVSVMLLQPGAQRIDVVSALLEAATVSIGDGQVSISTPVPFTGRIKLGLKRPGGRERSVDVDCAQSATIVQALTSAEAAEAADLAVSLDGRIIKGGSQQAAAAASPAPAAIISSAVVTGSVDPSDHVVTDALRMISFGGPIPQASARRGKAAGVWELAPPNLITGWAVDLENPARTLAVSLNVDGKDFGRYLANRNVQISPEISLDRGFEIDITRIDVPPGLKTFEVRFAESKVRLHPPVAAELVFPGRSKTTNVLEELDRLVSAGRIDEAAAVSSDEDCKDPGIAIRHFAIDAVTRRDWVGYDQIVDRVCGDLEGDARDGLKQLRSIIAAGDVSAFERALAALNLPQSYPDKLSPRLLEIRSEPAEAFSGSYARWVAQSQARRRPSTQETSADRIVILELSGADTPASSAGDGPIPRRSLSAETRKALLADGALDPAAIQELREATGAADWALLLGKPRVVPGGVEAFWPAVISNYAVCDVTVIAPDARSNSSPERELDAWSALVPTQQFDLVASAAKAAALGEARSLERNDAADQKRGELVLLSATGDRVIASTARCVCLHDFPENAPLPAAPSGVRLVRRDWSKQGGLPTPAEIRDAATAEGEAWDGGVIVLSSRITYPEDYLFDCLRSFDRSGAGVAFHGLAYDGPASKFNYDAYAGFGETSIALLPLGCYPAAMFARELPRGPLGELRIVHAEKPFRIVRLHNFPKREERDAIISDFAGGASPAEHLAGFDTSLRERHHVAYWRFQGVAPQVRLPGLSDDMAVALGKIGLRSALNRLGQGNVGEAQDAFRGFIKRRDFLDVITTTDLQGVLALARLTGQQDDLMTVLLPHMPTVVAKHPDLIIQLLENAAFVLEPDELAAVLISCAPGLLNQKSNVPISKLLEVSRRFCGEKVMIVLLTLIDQSPLNDVLLSPDIKRTIGSMLVSSGGPTFELAKTRLTRRDFASAAPNEVKLVTALLEGRRSAFIQILNDLILDSRNLLRIARLLRTYTNELRQFAIRGREIDYLSSRGVEEALQLALILGDIATASSHITLAPDNAGDQVQTDPLQIVYSSTQNRYGPLNQALRIWYSRYGIAPVSLAGRDINTIFASVFENHSLPKAEDVGRVTLICTVYNPDIELLKVSLRSMLEQTYQNIEIILVDDASDAELADGVAEAAKLDPRIRHVRSARNSGPYHGRNLALEICTGDYVAIHDGDDIAHPQRLEFQVRSLAGEPTFQMASGGHLRIDLQGQVQFEHTLELVGDGTMTSIFRKSLFDRVGGFAQVRSRGDVEFRERVRRSLGDHVISHTPVPLMFCLASPASLSNMTAARYGSYLALYRDGFAKRVDRKSVV